MRKAIPVILDTDIGSDIDDSWALAMLLKSPELDLKMILTDSGDTTYRTKITAKMLEATGRRDIPIGIGIPFKDDERFIDEWVKDYDLNDYTGPVFQDGVKAFVQMVMDSPEKITLISISSVPNLEAALELEPRIIDKLRFVGMYGSFYKGYGGSTKAVAEANVRKHRMACQKTFTAFKNITITPLDTCGLIQLDGDLFQKVLTCEDPLIKALMEQYHLWAVHCPWYKGINTQQISSVLFDTVAIYLAYSEEFLHIKKIGVHITNKGITRVDPSAKPIRVALTWKNMAGFRAHLVERLCSDQSNTV